MASLSSAPPRATSSAYRHGPNNRRQSQAPSGTPQPTPTASGGGGGGRVLTLPPYEAQVAELNATGKRALQGFPNSTTTRHLKAHLEQAAKALTDNAGQINDRLTDARDRCEKRKQRRRNKRAAAAAGDGGGGDGEGDGDGEDGDGEVETANKDDDENEEQRRLDELDKRVREATERMEEKVRGVVDSEVRIDALMETLGDLGREDVVVPPSLERSARSTRKRARRNGNEDEDGDVDMDGENDEGEENGPEDENENENEPEPVVPASRVLDTKLSEKKEHWKGLSLTERYSTHNTYISFKRMVHESEQPGNNIPPLPPASTWFSHLEEVPAEAEADQASSRRKKRKQEQTQQQQREEANEAEEEGEEEEEGQDEAEEQEQEQEQSANPNVVEDIAINSEKVSLQCPITLLRFKNPVTSTKCPHSFEREAIQDMIKQGGNSGRHRGGRRQQAGGVRGRVQCPVCTVQLTLKDLKTDPVLVRRVRRANEMDARDEEDDDDEGGGGDGEDEDVKLEAERRRKKRSLAIKTEKTKSPSRERSMVPDTQFEAVSDDDDDDDEDDNDGDEE